MYIESLHLTHFRNYSDVHIPLTQGVNIIYGSNGHGKTNLLEALHTVTQGHSFRTSRNLEYISWDANHCVVRAQGVAQNRQHTQSFKLTKTGKKTAKIDNQEYAQFSKLIGNFCMVPIVSNDIEIVQGAPAFRRKFIDSVLAQQSQSFLQALKDYNRTLKQRNALLKFKKKRDSLWETLTEQLCRIGSTVVADRINFIASMQSLCSAHYATISSNAEELSIKYHTSITPDTASFDPQKFSEFFFDKLAQKASIEFELGSTLYGPHKDDMHLFLDTHDARSFGSQGQCRSIALSLKLGAAHNLELAVGEPPILLLDDIFAELDNRRRGAIGTLISKHSQVLVATPHKEDLPFESSNVLHIHQGTLST